MKTSLHVTSEDMDSVKSYSKPHREDNDNEVTAVLLEGAVNAVEQGSDQQDQVEELLDMGVTVKACSNSMRENGVDEDDLIDGVETVPAGPVELSRLHEDGFSYLRL